MRKPRTQEKAELNVNDMFLTMFEMANNILDIANRFDIPKDQVWAAKSIAQTIFFMAQPTTSEHPGREGDEPCSGLD